MKRVRTIELTVQQIAAWMERLAPVSLAEDWDSVGLQVGDRGARVTRVLTALTLTPDVVAQAASAQAQLIVAHHPLIFRPLSSIHPHTRVGSIVTQLIKRDIALYVAHTNLDAAPGGVNDGLAARLELSQTEPLVGKRPPRRFKLVTFVPVGHEEAVRDALAQAGAGVIGNYTHCAFVSAGFGSFKPLEGASPYLGQVGRVERVEEVRLEMVVPQAQVPQAVAALKEAHPYEEVAYDLYPLEEGEAQAGIGRVGHLPRPMSARELAELVKERLRIRSVRLCGAPVDRVERVAVVGGSGGSFVTEAKRQGADALITGDVDYHDADEARHAGLLIIDAGHFGTEKHVPYDLKAYLSEEAARAGVGLTVEVAREDDPFWGE